VASLSPLSVWVAPCRAISQYAAVAVTRPPSSSVLMPASLSSVLGCSVTNSFVRGSEAGRFVYTARMEDGSFCRLDTAYRERLGFSLKVTPYNHEVSQVWLPPVGLPFSRFFPLETSRSRRRPALSRS